MKNWVGVCVWNPHHHAHPPSSFSFPHACTPMGCKSRLCRVACVATKLQTAGFQQITTFTFAQSETLRVYAHVRVGGCASESVGVCATPPSTPIFYENCHSHTDSLPCPPVAPKCVLMRLLRAHNACVVVPERQRIACGRAYTRSCAPMTTCVCSPIMRPDTPMCAYLRPHIRLSVRPDAGLFIAHTSTHSFRVDACGILILVLTSPKLKKY